MYEFKFEGFSKDQCKAYLKRIGAEFDGCLTKKNLDLLIQKHQQTVPFENLAICMGKGTVDLNQGALFDKIVTRRRGGFCFELNGAFLLLLKGLGYDAVGCMARVGIPQLGELLHLDHRGIIVRIDGNSYYADVGMAGPKADWAVDMSGCKETRHGQTYWIEDTYEGWKMLRNEGSESDGSVIIFSPVPVLPMDLIANCRYLVERGDTIFHNIRMVNICRENGYAALTGNTLKTMSNGEVTEKNFEEADFYKILEEHFEIPKEAFN